MFFAVQEANDIVKEWEKITFTFYKVGFFDPHCRFSTLSMTTEPFDANIPATVLYGLDVRRLVGQNVFQDERKDEILKFLALLQSGEIQPTTEMFKGGNRQEKDTFFAIANNVLAKICTHVTLSHDNFQSYVDQNIHPENVVAGRLGIGTQSTWHGYPDARVRALDVDTHLVQLEEDSNNPEDSPTSTLGDSCIIEGKITKEQFNVVQLMATTVVSAFIEHCLHADLNPLIPVVMVGAPYAQICLYDSQQDILLLSDKFIWVTNKDTPVISKMGLMLIWMTINHR